MAIWLDLARIAVRSTFRRSDQKLDFPDKSALCPKVQIFAVRTSESRSQVLYIDHFQYQVRWKMTGEEGDPFGGPRWHWPSKRSNFEKKSLITKTVKIAEKVTFFSFTLEKPRKSAIFLPPERQNYRLFRSTFPTVVWPFFSIFLRSKIPKFSHFFSDSGNRKKSCPDTKSRKSHFSGKVRIFEILVARQDFCGLRRIPFKVPKSRLFRDFPDFCDFSDFSENSGFFKISGFPDFSGNVQKVRFWTPQNSTFELPKSSGFRTFRTKVSDMKSSVNMRPVSWNISIFFCVFCVQKKWKNISLWPQPPSNCWLVYAVGSLRPDSFQHVTCHMARFWMRQNIAI